MRLRLLRYFALTLASLAPLLADQVVLTNGDVLNGTIVKKQGGKLVFKSDTLGEITIPWDSVKTIEAKDVTVIGAGGAELTGPVTTAGSALRVTTPAGARTEPLAGVADVRDAAEWQRLQHPSITQLWSGALSLQFALARGNAHTDTLTTGFTAVRPTLHDRLSVYFNQIYGTARLNGISAAVANAVRGGWAYNHDLTPRVSLGVFNDYDHDVFQDLDLRFVAGGDAGFTAVKSDTTNLTLLAGADYNHESFFNNVTRSTAELMFGDDLSYKLTGATALTQSFRVFPNLSNTGDYRLAFDVNAATKLNKWLSWQVTASDRFLSRPVFGRQRNDILLSTGLAVSFSH